MTLAIHEPRSVAEAAAMLDDLGPSARAYGGGTALLLEPRGALGDLVDLKRIAELRRIYAEGGSLVIGATVTLRELARDALTRGRLGELAALPGRIANARVLSAATIGGNLRLASPRTDPPVLLAALGARVRCANTAGMRELAVEKLWTSGLAAGDVITRVAVPLPDSSAAVCHVRFNPRGWPTANVAVALRAADGEIAEARIALAASGGRPARHRAAEEALAGCPLREAGVAALPAAELALADDEHGSAEYKRHLLGVLTTRAASAAADRLER